MITGVVRSAEALTIHDTCAVLLADPMVGLADELGEFDLAARAWLAEHRPDHSAGFADYMVRKAWSQHTVRTGRLELTVSELRHLALLIADAPDVTPAISALTRKINETAQRMGLGTLIDID